jgi:hypothetical protein
MNPEYVIEKADVTDPKGGLGPGWVVVDYAAGMRSIVAEVFDKDFAVYLEGLLRR